MQEGLHPKRTLQCDQLQVLRFLRAHKWNVDHAFDMIMKCLKWRVNELIDKIQCYSEILFKMISDLLDPAVASKIRFANSTEDLLAYIDEDSLIAEFGGKDPYKFEYLPPREDEDKPMYDTDAILEARKRRSKAIEEYQKVTREWANLDVTGEQLDKVSQERDAARNKVIEASRPYAARVRAKTLYHRLGVV
ncbi:hypothetical protein EV182_001999 [Spiromyces aspiralis]|uniref:Uncharacterized protein n=1 Tax=Spiromyces aspiralis TaxID=68401 RepID=A0ACC1HT31_9FUNG|nr:hypothetical protein EV182_001999 [Spiromyces aspiralis]